ncbi:hypothetical protein [Streptomyces sp. SID2119]|uniref:hypothetical protein n=1 Tax=Streptomyces sp. SID2119 TaxID=2690253 RepID=UPI00136BD949|nr:hypothetical protein [Streptomyces sp. SID2119]MYW29832.1 hypothetical protein [Streptomyces sp. SID2119]
MAVVVLLFLIAAAFLAVALIGPYRLYWRARPRAGRPSEAALAVGRVAAFGAAGAFVFAGCSAQEAADLGAWTASEVRKASEDAAESMASDPQIRRDPAEGYTSLIEAAVREAGEGQGPSYHVSVERAGAGHSYAISADGSEVCMHVTEVRSAQGGILVPEAGGGSGSIATYDLTATVEDGAC